MKKVILGTKSKRRIDLFSHFSLPFQVIGSDFDELSVSESLPAREYVREIAIGKANALSSLYPDQVILTADTTVYANGIIYNKPSSFDEAFSMIQALSGKSHEVWTGVCVRKGELIYTGEAVTKVFFYSLTETQIELYLKMTDYLDRAGAYSIQEGGGLLVEKIDGDFYNVVGFPISLVQKLLLHVGIDLWYHLKTPVSC